MKLTKTMTKLLERERNLRNGTAIWVDGAREAAAARALVAAGLALRYENQGGMTGGEYRVSPFTRRAYTTKVRYQPAGEIVFA